MALGARCILGGSGAGTGGKMNIKTIYTTLISAGAVVAAGTSLANWWPKVGWETPEQHKADMQLLREFRDEWKCDEYDEELLELLEDVQAGDDSAETQHRIDRIRKKMEKIDCQRFEDFG